MLLFGVQVQSFTLLPFFRLATMFFAFQQPHEATSFFFFLLHPFRRRSPPISFDVDGPPGFPGMRTTFPLAGRTAPPPPPPIPPGTCEVFVLSFLCFCIWSLVFSSVPPLLPVASFLGLRRIFAGCSLPRNVFFLIVYQGIFIFPSLDALRDFLQVRMLRFLVPPTLICAPSSEGVSITSPLASRAPAPPPPPPPFTPPSGAVYISRLLLRGPEVLPLIRPQRVQAPRPSWFPHTMMPGPFLEPDLFHFFATFHLPP